VHAVHAVPAAVVRAQVDAVVGDIGVDVAKTGMLATAGIVDAVAAAVPADVPLVVDPVLVSTSGAALLEPDAVGRLRDALVSRAAVVTPNLAEAAVLTGAGPITDRAGMAEAALALVALGAGAALVTGGHLAGDPADCLALAGEAEVRWLEGRRIDRPTTHGSGCVLSAAIAAELARGMEVADACVAAKRFVEGAIAHGVELGKGTGPVDPGWARD
jgi:hydroxymethylpyrimidine kinase/phosphomethylpyrimidine kinase